MGLHLELSSHLLALNEPGEKRASEGAFPFVWAGSQQPKNKLPESSLCELAALDTAVEEGGGNVACPPRQSLPELRGEGVAHGHLRPACICACPGERAGIEVCPDALALEGVSRSSFYLQCVHRTFKYRVLSRYPSCWRNCPLREPSGFGPQAGSWPSAASPTLGTAPPPC